jgi:hypothetical protein
MMKALDLIEPLLSKPGDLTPDWLRIVTRPATFLFQPRRAPET